VLSVHGDGRVEIATGTQSTGQGHETSFAQVAADLLDVPIETVKLVQGDSRAITVGGGTHSNRSMRIVGTLLVETCTELRERARAITAAHPGTPDDLFAIAAVPNGSANRSLPMPTLADGSPRTRPAAPSANSKSIRSPAS